jgi:hypothetical protein
MTVMDRHVAAPNRPLPPSCGLTSEKTEGARLRGALVDIQLVGGLNSDLPSAPLTSDQVASTSFTTGAGIGM